MSTRSLRRRWDSKGRSYRARGVWPDGSGRVLGPLFFLIPICGWRPTLRRDWLRGKPTSIPLDGSMGPKPRWGPTDAVAGTGIVAGAYPDSFAFFRLLNRTRSVATTTITMTSATSTAATSASGV